MRRMFCFCLMLLVLAGCASMGSSSDTASNPGSAPTSTQYYDQFQDVAIPVDMTASTKDTFITQSADGLKLGIQLFTGRVEMGSLITVMQRYMLRDGWNLRSVFRAQRSIQVFEKPERICTLYISDGLLSTEMLVFVSPRLPDGAAHTSTPAPETLSAPSEPVSSLNGVQTYPEGGFSAAASTSLRQ